MSEPWYINDPEIIYPKEEPWFAFSATLRIHGPKLDFNEISRTIGVAATHQHRKGEYRKGERERRGPESPGYRDDAWHFEPAVDKSRPLTEHIQALWAVVEPHVEYLKSLKRIAKVDVFCGYRSNNQTAGFEVDHSALKLFTALEVPFGVSVITLG